MADPTHLVSTYEKLLTLDASSYECSQCLLGAVCLIRAIQQLKPASLSRRVCIVGSIVEGAAASRLFGMKKSCMEADIMMSLFNLTRENASIVLIHATGRNKDGYFKVARHHVKNMLPADYVESYLHFSESQMAQNPNYDSSFISGLDIEQLANGITPPKQLSEWTLKLFGLDICEDSDSFNVDHTCEIHGPSINIILTLQESLTIIAILSFDLVTFIQLDYWPDEASGWITRQRRWPSSILVSQAVQLGAQLVPKPQKITNACTGDLETGDPMEWRLSFTKAENLLAQNRTHNQKLVYQMAKAIFYKHLHLEIKGNQFSSYALKTVMMWHLEDTPEEEWSRDNIFSHIQALFDRLSAALKKGILPNYFMPTVNVLGEYTNDLLKKVMEAMDKVTIDIPGHLPGVDEVDGVARKVQSLESKIYGGIARALVYILGEKYKQINKEIKESKAYPQRKHLYKEYDLD